MMNEKFPPTTYSNGHPPKARKDLGLSCIESHLVDGVGVLVIDPNRAAVIGFTGKLPLINPTHPSLLSGKPGYLLRTSDGVEVALTEDELLRMFRHELRPNEVKLLLETYGSFHEIHDDFYDEETGEALQPMGGDAPDAAEAPPPSPGN